jgi:adenosylcobinamide kinase/adenosylcobinamide-phosphate guanylyltransferase
MARVILVTGGARSGKSRHALKLCSQLPGPRAFVATCQAGDEEMEERIRRHQQARRDTDWDTIEEPIELAATVRAQPAYRVMLVDCLTLWISNLLGAAHEQDRDLEEEEVEERCRRVLEACEEREGTTVFVTNEVGDGIVPGNALARRYRDLVGRCNQTIAAGAGEVTLVTCGIPMKLKQE